MLLSYTTEPGIIPRNHPEFRIKENENNENKVNKDKNLNKKRRWKKLFYKSIN